MHRDQPITITYSGRTGAYSIAPAGAESVIEAITGPVDYRARAMALGEACRAGGALSLGELAARFTAANDQLMAARAKKGRRLVTCDCGHECWSHLVMSASLGTACPDCYDRLSD